MRVGVEPVHYQGRAQLLDGAALLVQLLLLKPYEIG
jgi:hypothetical protein